MNLYPTWNIVLEFLLCFSDTISIPSPFYDNTHYIFNVLKQSWDDGMNYCRETGGFLVVPKSKAEVDFIRVSNLNQVFK